ncbi:MAG: hypothetical protein KDA46_15330 [Parvularculaceae bacterium]|nr:hypothetical protein [Parvularculaceae bacterium]
MADTEEPKLSRPKNDELKDQKSTVPSPNKDWFGRLNRGVQGVLTALVVPILIFFLIDVFSLGKELTNPDPERRVIDAIGAHVSALLANWSAPTLWVLSAISIAEPSAIVIRVIDAITLLILSSLAFYIAARPDKLRSKKDKREFYKLSNMAINISVAVLAALIIWFSLMRFSALYQNLEWTKRPYSYFTASECRGDYEQADVKEPLYLRLSPEGSDATGAAVVRIPSSISAPPEPSADRDALVFAEEGDWGLVKYRAGVKPVDVRSNSGRALTTPPKTPSNVGESDQTLQVNPAFVSVRLCILRAERMVGAASAPNALPADITRKSNR